MSILRFILNGYLFVFYKLHKFFTSTYCVILLKLENAQIGIKHKMLGIPIINVAKKNGQLIIGNYFSMNSGKYYNQIGRQQPCFLIVGSDSKLLIGNNVGISSTAIICYKQIIIEDNVKIGGNTVIYDSDFHDLDSKNELLFRKSEQMSQSHRTY